MKAITIWQPWATLWILGAKRYETRSWATDYRGELAVHAAKRDTLAVYRQELHAKVMEMQRLAGVHHLRNLPRGRVLGTGTLVACHPITEAFVAGLSEQERMLGDFTPGRYAWELSDRVVFERPLLATGRQKLWNWDESGMENLPASEPCTIKRPVRAHKPRNSLDIWPDEEELQCLRNTPRYSS